MKKAIFIVITGLFLASCGSGNSNLEIKPDTVTGTIGTVDTLQPILDSAAYSQDSLLEIDTNKYSRRFGKRIAK
jgi:hypothetical protein